MTATADRKLSKGELTHHVNGMLQQVIIKFPMLMVIKFQHEYILTAFRYFVIWPGVLSPIWIMPKRNTTRP